MPKARNMAGSWGVDQLILSQPEGAHYAKYIATVPPLQIFRPSNILMSFENADAIRIYFSSEIISTQYEISTQHFLTFDRCCEWALNIHGRSNNFRQTDSVYRKLFFILLCKKRALGRRFFDLVSKFWVKKHKKSKLLTFYVQVSYRWHRGKTILSE